MGVLDMILNGCLCWTSSSVEFYCMIYDVVSDKWQP
jgi:hypothetical protein